ncbi:hypothetical protein KUTeg_007988 [Tegillarca granosa]|uniref:Uncharacterized protein n=1 Tax=Tegillarca granosa TaxID=220873 RepID=A0ABQ9FJE0_TEGGR|nr:hypothetical protein KUTeg_007988 [Tegillarca granosa]
MVTVAGGFLVPFKTKGTVNIFDISGTSISGPYDIADDSSDHEWFYHRVLWADMNGDGQDDAKKISKTIFCKYYTNLVTTTQKN